MSSLTNHSERFHEARKRWLGIDPCEHDSALFHKELGDVLESLESIYSKDGKGSAEIGDKHTHCMAGERLALLLMQTDSGTGDNARKADSILQDLGFTCRLSQYILNFRSSDSLTASKRRSSSTTVPCSVVDNFLSPAQLEGLQHVFLDPLAPYWKDHNYQVEPPSPYYSYAIPLSSPKLSANTLLGSIVRRLLDHVSSFQPSAAKQANYVELWAHNRPIATGHQLHFDSDNEGAGETIRHPLTTSILYLSTTASGPTLITNQRLVSRHAAEKGWLVAATTNRVVHMDGRVLHCVVPGNVVVEHQEAINNPIDTTEYGPRIDGRRRVSVMMALWKSIRIREEATPGAARPFPSDRSWADELIAPIRVSSMGNSSNVWNDPTPVDPVALKHVYEKVSDGCPWSRDDGMPDYDQVFQGV